MKSGFEKGFATRARIILHEQEKLKKENSKPTPVIGPRGKLMHYIYDLNLDLENAMKEILKEFPALDEKLIKQWYVEEKNKRQERMNLDEGR